MLAHNLFRLLFVHRTNFCAKATTEHGLAMEETIIRIFQEIVGEKNLKRNEPMSKHTTFRVGGEAACFITPDSLEMLSKVVKTCNEQKITYYIVGNGSNLIVKDSGFRGAIIHIGSNLQELEIKGNIVRAQAGILLSQLAKKAAEYSLTGLEFAAGIPGTLGGAVTMNAGAYEGEIKQILISAKILDQAGAVREIKAEELELGYRTSNIIKNNYIVIEAVLKLQEEVKEQIIEKMNDYSRRRKEKQPLEYPSAGSTFKRPEGYYAGKLIMDAGLKGYCIGGAKVSEKHCGFIINSGGATASDILDVIEYVTEKVYEMFGVRLETEVKIIG